MFGYMRSGKRRLLAIKERRNILIHSAISEMKYAAYCEHSIELATKMAESTSPTRAALRKGVRSKVQYYVPLASCGLNEAVREYYV